MRGWWLHRRCGYHNLYIGRKGASKRTIDVQCRYCGQRVTFESHRPLSGRGRTRAVSFTIRPDHMPRHALQKEVRSRNGHVPENAVFHFRKLKEIVEVQELIDEHGSRDWRYIDSNGG